MSFSARFCFAYVSGFFCTDLSTTTSSKNHNNNNILVKPTPHPIKTPSWCQAQLKEAISCILTQQMRFTQASAKFKIPKGTLYDNILGKTKRSRMLEEIGLSCEQERAVLEFACDIVLMPYNRRTSRPLIAIVNFVKSIMSKHQQPPHSQQTTQQQQQAHSQSSTNTSSSAAPPLLPAGDDNSIFSSPPKFEFPIRKAFKWWWAFCKKYSVISLYYKEKSQNANVPIFEAEEEKATTGKKSSSSSSLQNQGNNNEQKQLCNSRTIFASTTADSNSSFATLSSSASSSAAAMAAAAAAYPIFYYPSPYFYALSDFNSQAYSTSTSVRKMK